MNVPVPLIFHASGLAGSASLLKNEPNHVRAKKRAILVQVRFARTATLVATLEGPVYAQAGDAIVTGSQGEQWPVALRLFREKYQSLQGQKQDEDGIYQTLPIEVLALSVPVEFIVVLAGGESRLHGKAGDWLIDYGDGTLGIVTPAIFDATYDVMEAE